MKKQFTTSVVVFRELKIDSAILLIHHKKFNRWMIPGGHIEISENPNEAAIREVYEESGIEIDLISFIHDKIEAADSKWILPPEYFYEQVIPPSSKEEKHIHLDLAYLGLAKNENLVLNEIETNGLKWIDIKKLKNVDLFDGTRKIINASINNLRKKTSINEIFKT